jgi:hypothetical protein
MHEFVSDQLISERPMEDLYGQISDFHNLEKLMPEQVINWRIEGDVCSFTIKGMADLQIRYADKVPDQSVRIVPVKAPFHFEIAIKLTPVEAGGATNCQTTIRAELNPMLSMLASRPLKHLAATINERLVGQG